MECKMVWCDEMWYLIYSMKHQYSSLLSNYHSIKWPLLNKLRYTWIFDPVCPIIIFPAFIASIHLFDQPLPLCAELPHKTSVI